MFDFIVTFVLIWKTLYLTPHNSHYYQGVWFSYGHLILSPSFYRGDGMFVSYAQELSRALDGKYKSDLVTS